MQSIVTLSLAKCEIKSQSLDFTNRIDGSELFRRI